MPIRAATARAHRTTGTRLATCLGAAWLLASSVAVAPAAPGARPRPPDTAIYTGHATASKWTTRRVHLAAGQRLSARLSWRPRAVTTQLRLRRRRGSWVATSHREKSGVRRLRWRAPIPGSYLLAVRARKGSVAFRLKVSRIAVRPAKQPPPRGIAASANWFDEQESPTHKFTVGEAVAQAKRFAVISALPRTYATDVPAMKHANPNLVLLAYMNGTMATGSEVKGVPESWFLHDARGKRITNPWHLYLMNLGNQGWVRNRVATCRELLRASGYDGCFLDNLGTGTWAPNMASGTPIDPSTHRPYTAATWLRQAAAVAAAVRSGTGAPVFSNGLVNGATYFDKSAPSKVLLRPSDLALAESWLRAPRSSVAAYPTETVWRENVDMLRNAAAEHKRVATITKIWAANATTAQKLSWHDFALASFLLGTDGRQLFEFSYAPGSDLAAGDRRLHALSRLGRPTGGYVDSNGVYSRTYRGGFVVVNPTSEVGTVTLPSGCWQNTANGSTLCGPTETVPAHTGLILLSRH